MKLWMGAEIEASIGDVYREARKDVESRINEKIAGIDAGEANEWDVITIMRDDDYFEERIRFSKRDGMDLRLQVKFTEFRDADLLQRKYLLLDMLQRSLDIITKKFPHIATLDEARRKLQEVREEI